MRHSKTHLYRWLAIILAAFPLLLGCTRPKTAALNRLKQSYQCQGCDLQGVDLSGFNPLQPDAPPQALLSLHRAQLVRANLSRIRLWRCLRGVADGCFNDIDVSEADLSQAVLDHARLYGVNFARARLHGSQMRNASCDLCDFSKTDFSHACLRGFTSEGDAMHGWGSQFDGANFAGANLSHARLYGSFVQANFSHAKLRHTTLASAEDADGSGRTASALWAGVNFTDADLTGARVLNGRGFSNDPPADLSQAILCRTTMPDGTVNHRDCHERSFKYPAARSVCCKPLPKEAVTDPEGLRYSADL
ncbi:Putative conserved protein, pentapeptide repeat family [Candidatus Glomeribacter gigasporarum BEG34]|uniref:Putative conserved protein, pentapeptide repeat family n=1 Tax=Candidatus Glomeribacter gigasporarum BEG34 TaxID=1070319 RepID=G2JBK1_9BURK|nr:pentapeptide repeat-containing protein [Candidatus Glomeribacter gigasporarum]CCD30155.1 Putative conserved protein, pentapeptide repeat family [Candidatus Glomeribacter gigasporarum BEG34]